MLIGFPMPVTLKVCFLDPEPQRCRQTCEKYTFSGPILGGLSQKPCGGEWRAAIYILRSLQVIWMHTQVWEPLPYINFTVPGIKPLWGNRRNRFCSVPDSLSSGIYWLYLYISSVLGHLLRWEWQKEFANGDHPSELLQQSAFCFCFSVQGIELTVW